VHCCRAGAAADEVGDFFRSEFQLPGAAARGLIQNGAAATLSKTWRLLSAQLSFAGAGDKKLSARQKIA
jgi:hypothetical protein